MSILHTKKGRYLLALLSLVLFVCVSLVLFVVLSPEEIINWVGVKNAYVLIFVMAIAGGFTTFNIIPYHPVLVALALGGLNPYILGILAATGVTLGDSTSYWLGTQGRVLLSDKTNKWFLRVHRLGERNPKLQMFLFFLYSTFMPTSNDLLTIPAGMARIPFWRVMIPLLLGNIIFDTAQAYFATRAPDFVSRYFS